MSKVKDKEIEELESTKEFPIITDVVNAKDAIIDEDVEETIMEVNDNDIVEED